MAELFLRQYNFAHFLGATNINITSAGSQPASYIDELSADNSNVYLTNQELNYYLTPDTSYTKIYMNSNLKCLARELTDLTHTDFLSSVCNYSEVIDMHTSYSNCFMLAGSPKVGDSVTKMYGTYYNASNLTGAAKVSPYALNLIGTYYNCSGLTSINRENTNATMMINTFYNCVNIAGSPIDADYAQSLSGAYYNCISLTGNPANCNNAFITTNAYYNCNNLYGDFYWLYNKASQADIVDMTNMFYQRNYSNKLNIYVTNHASICNALVNYADSYGNLYGIPLDWTLLTDSSGKEYYNNATTNTNIFLVEDLSKPIDFDFVERIQTFVIPVTGWYLLETWGAQGGSANNGSTEARGGYGSYSKGEMLLNKDDILYIVVGGQNGYGGGGTSE